MNELTIVCPSNAYIVIPTNMTMPLKSVAKGSSAQWLGCRTKYCIITTVPRRKKADESIANTLITRISVNIFVNNIGTETIEQLCASTSMLKPKRTRLTFNFSQKEKNESQKRALGSSVWGITLATLMNIKILHIQLLWSSWCQWRNSFSLWITTINSLVTSDSDRRW